MLSLDFLLEKYQGEPLCMNELSSFDQTALKFFINSDHVDDPFIDSSFMHDISLAAQNFKQLEINHPEASFTAFLFWCAARSLLELRHFSWRFFNNTWYEFNNLPFFMPIQTGNPQARLAATLLENIKYMSFSDFIASYNTQIAKARKNTTSALGEPAIYLLAHHLVNLPHLRFSSLKQHSARIKSTNVSWVFGQRYYENTALKVPMMIRMHHANGDPLILDELIRSFTEKSSLFFK